MAKETIKNDSDETLNRIARALEIIALSQAVLSVGKFYTDNTVLPMFQDDAPNAKAIRAAKPKIASLTGKMLKSLELDK